MDAEKTERIIRKLQKIREQSEAACAKSGELRADARRLCQDIDALIAAKKDAIARGRRFAQSNAGEWARCALVVEKSGADGLGVGSLLWTIGMRVRSSRNPVEALDLVKKHGFDLVVVDLQIPGVNTIELVEKLKRLQPALPILMVAKNPPGFVPPIQGVLLKPFSADRLQREIERLISGRVRQEAGPEEENV